jgi:branched-chain amino acid transport system substrate-binding protein
MYKFFIFFALFLPSLLAQAEPVKTAALLPLTGSGAEQGEWIKRGFEMAQEDLKGKSKLPIEIIYEDTRGDPASAVSAYRNLVSQNKIKAVFTWGSGVALALAPMNNKEAIIQMGVATATAHYTSKGDFTFRNYHSATLEGQFIASQINAGNFGTKVALLTINNDYGLGIAENVRKNVEDKKAKIVFDEEFSGGDTDFRTTLIKLKNAQPDFIVLTSYITEGALIIKQLKQLGINKPILAAGAIIGGGDFFSLVGGGLDNLYIVKPGFDSEEARARGAEFDKKYNAKYKDGVGVYNWYSARAYDALKMVSIAIDNCAPAVEGNCVKGQLFKIQNYPGTAGTVSFDENGDISCKFELIKSVGQTFQLNN